MKYEIDLNLKTVLVIYFSKVNDKTITITKFNPKIKLVQLIMNTH